MCGLRLRQKEKEVCLGCATKTDRVLPVAPLSGNMLDWVISDYRITLSVLALPVIVIVTSLAVGDWSTALAVLGGLALIFTIYEISNRRH
jgi:hypothetical protein